MTKSFGADLSLNHGSVVAVEMTADGKEVIQVESIYKWDKKDSHKLTLKSSMSEIHKKVAEICRPMSGFENARVAVDWAGMSVYWRTKKLFVVQMGLFVGMLYSRAMEKAIQINFITPKELREYFLLPQKISKEDFQKYVLMLFSPPTSFLQWANDDDIDAYILAIYNIIKPRIA